jgi:hypothetical protein
MTKTVSMLERMLGLDSRPSAPSRLLLTCTPLSDARLDFELFDSPLTLTFSSLLVPRLSTTLTRSGKGRNFWGIDSQVLRPMTCTVQKCEALLIQAPGLHRN